MRSISVSYVSAGNRGGRICLVDSSEVITSLDAQPRRRQKPWPSRFDQLGTACIPQIEVVYSNYARRALYDARTYQEVSRRGLSVARFNSTPKERELRHKVHTRFTLFVTILRSSV